MWEVEYKRHVQSVMKSGKPARATVVSAEMSTSRFFGSQRTGDVSWGWNVNLQVVPEDAPPFDLQTKMEVPIVMTLVQGTELQVIYNPNKPESIIVDPEGAPKDLKQGLTQYEIDSVRLSGGDTTGMQEAAEAASDPIEAAKAAREAATRNQIAQRDATLAEINRVRTEQGDEAARAVANDAVMERVRASTAQFGAAGDAFAQLIQERIAAGPPGVGPQAAGPPAAGAPGAGAADPTAAIEARLEQLNKLKASGALNDAEYAAARKRLIDSV
jgi:hypothetical protein